MQERHDGKAGVARVKEGAIDVVGSPERALRAVADEASHQVPGPPVRRLAVNALFGGAKKLGRRLEGRIVIDDVLFAVVREREVVFLEKGECVFGSLQVRI